MKQRAEDFYSTLSGDYASKIRQLVPKYDDMITCIANLLRLASARAVVDLGGGVGELEQVLLAQLPGARITMVDACAEAVGEARNRLAWAEDRVEVVERDILQYESPAALDAVVSNLVIHNIDPDAKATLLAAVARWLRPAGWFIWGDFIRHADPAIHDHFVQERKTYALEAGCPEALVAENFAKEAESDFPLTVGETLHLADAAGFAGAHVAWLHDTFAVFCLTTPVP